MKRQCHPTLSLFFFLPKGVRRSLLETFPRFPLFTCLTMTDFRVSNVYFTKRATNPRGFCSEKVMNKLAMTLDKAKRLIYILNV